MDALGLSLIAGGLVLLVSGLIVLLQTRRNKSARQDAEQTINEIDDRLREMRRDQGDTS
jgi:hypothetical protein